MTPKPDETLSPKSTYVERRQRQHNEDVMTLMPTRTSSGSIHDRRISEDEDEGTMTLLPTSSRSSIQGRRSSEGMMTLLPTRTSTSSSSSTGRRRSSLLSNIMDYSASSTDSRRRSSIFDYGSIGESDTPRASSSSFKPRRSSLLDYGSQEVKRDLESLKEYFASNDFEDELDRSSRVTNSRVSSSTSLQDVDDEEIVEELDFERQSQVLLMKKFESFRRVFIFTVLVMTFIVILFGVVLVGGGESKSSFAIMPRGYEQFLLQGQGTSFEYEKGPDIDPN